MLFFLPFHIDSGFLTLSLRKCSADGYIDIPKLFTVTISIDTLFWYVKYMKYKKRIALIITCALREVLRHFVQKAISSYRSNYQNIGNVSNIASASAWKVYFRIAQFTAVLATCESPRTSYIRTPCLCWRGEEDSSLSWTDLLHYI